jgi:hypothetical protein
MVDPDQQDSDGETTLLNVPGATAVWRFEEPGLIGI